MPLKSNRADCRTGVDGISAISRARMDVRDKKKVSRARMDVRDVREVRDVKS